MEGNRKEPHLPLGAFPLSRPAPLGRRDAVPEPPMTEIGVLLKESRDAVHMGEEASIKREGDMAHYYHGMAMVTQEMEELTRFSSLF